jgi:hypothetical protein
MASVRRGAVVRFASMEFLILGPLEVSEDGPKLALGGSKQRAVLAHLILRANRVVPAGLLIDGLWARSRPRAPATSCRPTSTACVGCSGMAGSRAATADTCSRQPPRRWTRRTAGSRVVVRLPPFYLSPASWDLVGDYMIELLDELGYVGSVERVADFDDFYTPELEFDMPSTHGSRITRRRRTSSPTGSHATRLMSLRRGSATHASTP